MHCIGFRPLATLLLVIAPTCFVLAAEPVNLIANGGFEEGMVGWTPDPAHSLATNRAAAHSGANCLTGEATLPSQALYLRRRVPVKAANRYQFEIWARGTNKTKLVLWVVPPGADQSAVAQSPTAEAWGATAGGYGAGGRQQGGSWEGLTNRWNRYTSTVSVPKDGTMELQIIAPSSHGAPPGRIWVDDVALYETEMPAETAVSSGKGFNDEPAMAAAADGTVYVAWNSFRDGFDSLQIARYQPEGKQFKPLGEWQVLGGRGTYLLGIAAVGAGEQVAIVYAAEKDKNWDICAVMCGPDGPAKPVAVTSEPAVDVKPAAAWRGGTLWVAWESNRNGSRQVFAASVRDGKLSPATAVSREGVSSYGPSLAVLSSGEVCVAWHSFRDNNFDIFLRRMKPDGSWQAETRLTKAPTIDRHPVLVPRGDDLWIIYENAEMGSAQRPYALGSTFPRRLIAAQITAEGLLAPKNYAAASPLYGRCEAPAAVFDSSGRLWIALRQPREPREGWDVYLTALDGNRWQKPSPLSSRKGLDRRPSLVLGGDRLLVAYQADEIPKGYQNREESFNTKSDVFLASQAVDPAEAASRCELEPLVENQTPFEPGVIRVARGEDSPTPSIEYNGQALKLFYGDLHDHTDVSVCGRLQDESIDESYGNMRDIARHDFACVTDHGYNINPYLWNYTAKMARVNHDPSRFVAFLAEEWTSTFEEYSEAHPYGFYGHRNLVFSDPYFPRWWNARNRQTPAELWEDLRKLNANFVNIPHQLADTGNVPTDWNFTDETAQPVAEIFQGRGSYEYKGTPREAARTVPAPGSFIQDAWARGIVIGVIASPDHTGGYGKACVFAPELTREAILDALRARRCYGTTAAKIFLDVRVSGHLMGEKVAKPAGASTEVKIAVQCPAEIDTIEVCRNNRFIYTTRPGGRAAELTFVDREPLPGRSYYYVRVIQKDEEIAWSSPVWFGAE